MIPAAVRDEIVAHARAGLPNEACGILAGSGDRVERFYPAEPDEPSPFYYRIESRDQIRIMNAIDDEGLDLVGIYHSHPFTRAYPSATDLAQAWEGLVYVIVSLRDFLQPMVKAFTVADGAVSEQPIEIVDPTTG